VETQWPDARIYAHLTREHLTLYIDTSGEPLFKRGWRTDKGDAPLKETLAAAMIAASGWDATVPLYDPCCGSGTIPIEAAQIACGIAAGSQRRFGFEKLLPYQAHVWQGLKDEARAMEHPPTAPVFGSDVAHRMVDFAQRNAERAGVARAVQLRGGDALQRMPPSEVPGIMLLNPPYGERIEAKGSRGERGAERAVRAWVQLFQGTPLLMQLFLAYFGLALLGLNVSAWVAASLALTLYTSAFLVEIWRGCVLAVPRGQWEAADSLALSFSEKMRHVIGPQALRIAVPPTVGFLVQVIKGTALASVIGFVELTKAGSMISNATFQPFLVYACVALLYFALCFPVSLVAQSLERKLHGNRR